MCEMGQKLEGAQWHKAFLNARSFISPLDVENFRSPLAYRCAPHHLGRRRTP
jgi:hypothetical protein